MAQTPTPAALVARALALASGPALFLAVRDSLLGPEAVAALRRAATRSGDGGGAADHAGRAEAEASPAAPKRKNKRSANPVGRNYKPTLEALSSALLSAQDGALATVVAALTAAVERGAGLAAGASASSSSSDDEDAGATTTTTIPTPTTDDDDNTTTPPSLAAVVAHVLAEAVPPASALPVGALCAARPSASALLSRLVAEAAGLHGAKLAAKVAQSFALEQGDVAPSAWCRLRALVPALMADRQHQAAAVRLLMSFPSLAGELDGPLVPLPPVATAVATTTSTTTTSADDQIDAALTHLVDEGQEALAERWAASLPRARRAAFVRACIATDRLKAAARAVQAFGLQRDFPGAERAYREKSVARMAERRLWPLALGFVRGDRGLQRQLLTAMAEAGEAQLAATYADQLRYFVAAGQEDEQEDEAAQADARLLAALRMDPTALAEAEARRRAAHLPLLPRTRLVLVDDEIGLLRAAAALRAAPILAIDVEWRPGGGRFAAAGAGGAAPQEEEQQDGGGEEVQEDDDGTAARAEARVGRSNRSHSRSRSRSRGRRRQDSGTAAAAAAVPKEQAALLQIAVWGLPARGADDDGNNNGAHNGDVFLFDLFALAQDPAPRAALDACLAPAFTSDATLVLGFEAAGDLSKLASSWPAVAAFKRVERVLDLRALWVAYVTALRAAGAGGLPTPSSGSSSGSDSNSEDDGGAAAVPPPSSVPSLRALTGAGLSTLSRALLGLPLDKSMQLSDWMVRPLTARQIEYAALDAQVLPRLRARLRQELGAPVADAVERRAEFSFVAGGGRDASGGGGDGGGGDGLLPGTAATADTAAPALDASSPLLSQLTQLGLAHCARRHRANALGAPSLEPTDRARRSTASREGKAVALFAGDGPVVAVARACDRVDLRKLARHLQLERRAVRVASRRECVEVFGYAPGTVPPVGHGTSTAIVIDFRLNGGGGGDGDCSIVFGAGDDRLELALTFEQLLRVAGSTAAVADVAEPGGKGAEGGQQQRQEAAPPPLPPALPPPKPSSSSSPSSSAAAATLLREPPRFLVDSMCGRLARWLRCLGLDAESLDAAMDRLVAQADGADAAVDGATTTTTTITTTKISLLAVSAAATAAAAATTAAATTATATRGSELLAAQRGRALRLAVADHHARLEGRVLLTRDAQLATSREGLALGVFLLASDDAVAQLAELASHFGRDLLESRVSGDGEALLTRCAACNVASYARLSKEEARGLVPPRAWEAVDEFWRCQGCLRCVWWGPKSDRAVGAIRDRVARALAMLPR